MADWLWRVNRRSLLHLVGCVRLRPGRRYRRNLRQPEHIESTLVTELTLGVSLLRTVNDVRTMLTVSLVREAVNFIKELPDSNGRDLSLRKITHSIHSRALSTSAPAF